MRHTREGKPKPARGTGGAEAVPEAQEDAETGDSTLKPLFFSSI